jgi:1-acyl-sn-glycerol-3-phosphate acyltransferase
MTLAKRGLLALWSMVFWAAAFSWMLVGVVGSIALLVVGFPYTKVHVWVTGRMFKRTVQLSLTRLHLHYHPEFDRERRSVFAQNHVNLLDGHLAAWAIPHAFSGLMHAWQFKIPIYGWLMSLSKGIPVTRGRRDETIRMISDEARQRRAIGMSVLVFPEGHRTLDGMVRQYRKGVFLMARNAGYPVVPIAARGMYDLNRKGSWIFHPLQRVDVFVGPQFETAGLTDDEVGKFADRIREWTVYCLEHGTWPEEAAANDAGRARRPSVERAPTSATR